MSGEVRIAYVINSVEGGGAASPVPSVVSVLRDGGATVAVFALTPRDRRGAVAMREAGIEVHVREGGATDHLAALRWLDGTLARWRPTHVWTSLTRATLLGQLVGRRRGWPVASWQHAAFLLPANRRLLRATQALSALWIGDSTAVTRFAAERLGVPPDRLATWPIFRADPAWPRARAWVAGEPVRIGSVGRLHPVKGFDTLIEAAAMLRGREIAPFEIAIAGDGAERAALEAQAAARGVPVRFVGYAAPRDFLAGLHLYAQPSRSEGFCIAAHEAIQAGLPAVASAVGELANTIVPGETGALVAPRDPQALADALGQLLARPERLAAMGDAGRARVLDRFGPDRFEAAGLAALARLTAAR